ncbi:MAG: hypothetical protein WBQ50_20740 [Nocardioides sp.]
MTEPFPLIATVVSLLFGMVALSQLVRDQPIGRTLLVGAAVWQLALLALLVSGIVALAQTDRDVSGITFVSYLVGIVVVPPAVVLWALFEPGRWGTGVLLVGAVLVPVLVLRLDQIWTAGA